MPGPSANAPRPEATQAQWTSTDATPVGGYAAGPTPVVGTTVIYIGIADEAGHVLRSIKVVPSVSVPQSPTSYHTFRPFITTVADGAATVRYVGTPRSTANYNLNANIALRVHEEEFLNLPLVKGTSVGVEITTTSFAVGVPGAVRITFQAGLIRHGR